MARIKKIIGVENKDSYALVHVLIDDGTEAAVYVGGVVEVYFAHNRVSAFVKKSVDKSIDSNDNVVVD